MLIRDDGFLNAVTIMFYALALLVVIPAVLKYLDRRLRGLIPLPNNAVLLHLDHEVQHETRERPILGVRETTIRFRTQPVVFTRLAAESQDVPVICATCQQRVIFRVDSRRARRQSILRRGLTYGTMLVVSMVLAVVFISDSAKVQTLPGWLGPVIGLGFLVLFVWGLVGVGILLNDGGVRRVDLPLYHHLRHPTRAELVSFHQKIHQTQ